MLHRARLCSLGKAYISFEHPRWSLKLKFSLLLCGNAPLPAPWRCCSPPHPQVAADKQHCQVVMTLFFHRSPLSALITLPLATLMFFLCRLFPLTSSAMSNICLHMCQVLSVLPYAPQINVFHYFFVSGLSPDMHCSQSLG